MPIQRPKQSELPAGRSCTERDQQRRRRLHRRGQLRKDHRSKSDHNLLQDLETAKGTLKILVFQAADEKWLDFICANRQMRCTDDYDIAIGPVADDQVYKVIVQYENGYIDKLETLKRLKTEQLTDQILFHTERSLEYLTFISSEDS